MASANLLQKNVHKMDSTRSGSSIKRKPPFFCLLVTAVFSTFHVLAQSQIDMDAVINEIDQHISTENFTLAQEKLTELMALGIRDERIDMLSGRLKLFDSIDKNTIVAKPSLANSSALTQRDKITATDLFDSLRIALENGELKQVTELSEPSESTRALLQALFTSYAALEIKLSDISTDKASNSFLATLEFIELKTKNGDTAYPADAWKTQELRVTKSPGEWRKVRW